VSAPVRPARWFLRPLDDSARARLFCLPYSGCGASMYRAWPATVGDLEIVPVQLPGRENRLRERPHETYEALAVDVIEAIEPYLDRPFGFFGHCGSALSSYEIAVQLVGRGGPQDGPYGTYIGMDDVELAEEVRRLIRFMGGAPTDDLVALCLRVMRADVDANARYRMAEPVRLPCRVSAIGWQDDTNVPARLMPGWRDCGRTEFHLLPGSHFTFLRAPAALRAVLLAGMDLDQEGSTS
jgi:surfactin synthase thioesterase subunit